MKYMLTLILFTLTSVSALASGTHEGGHGMAKFAVGEPTMDEPDRTFDVSMRDTMRFVFSPEFEDLHEGEVIRFNVRNEGNIVHEFSIGNAAEQEAHAEMMRKMPDMKHEDPNTVSLQPGETGTITWRFMGKDTVIFSCNVPGHYEAGMHHGLPIEAT